MKEIWEIMIFKTRDPFFQYLLPSLYIRDLDFFLLMFLFTADITGYGRGKRTS